MAKTSTLTDEFATADGAKWDYAAVAADVTVTAGQLHVSNGVGLQSISTYDLTSSYIYIEVPTAGSSFGLSFVDFNTFTGGVGVIFDGSTLMLQDLFLETDLGSVTYNATSHRWVRLREASGTVFMDGSPDGTSWTSLASGAFTAGTAWTILPAGDGVVFDNFNTLPSAPPSNTSAFFAMF